MRRLSLAAAVFLSLAGACHTPTEPEQQYETFMLVSIDGHPLPATRSNDPVSNGALILHEELSFDGRGMVLRNITVQGSTPNTVVASSIPYAYTRTGNVITIGEALCHVGPACAPHSPEQGQIDANGLTIFSVPSLSSFSGSVSVYQRMPLIG